MPSGKYTRRPDSKIFLKEDPVLRFWSHVKKSNGCWLWDHVVEGARYGQFRLEGRMVRAHRLSYTMSYGDIPGGMYVCHKCDTPACVRPEHLFLGTQQDNVTDMISKERGNWARGSKCGRSRLSSEQVLEMRALYDSGSGTFTSLGRQFGVSNVAAKMVVLRRVWKHI